MSQKIQPQNIPLGHFGFLKISGVDAMTFLQGYTTCDLAALKDDSAQLGAICNIQGRMLASFIVIQQGQDLVLRMHQSLVPKTIAFLTKYICFQKLNWRISLKTSTAMAHSTRNQHLATHLIP